MQVFKFEDRKGSRFLLAPTHEEEITTLVGGLVKSYKELPLRLYQMSKSIRLMGLLWSWLTRSIHSKEVP